MPHVTQHMVTSKDLTPVFRFDDLKEIKQRLPKGFWLGIIESKLDKLKILTTQGEGWIRMSDATKSNLFDLKIVRDQEGNINYSL